jgi:hypothetical protein
MVEIESDERILKEELNIITEKCKAAWLIELSPLFTPCQL